jgi:putative transcriptional regulator
MTQPTRHPSPETLLDFARGALEDGRSLVLSAHLGACAECRAAVRLGEAVGGALLSELEPAAMAPDALDQALAAIERPAAAPAAPDLRGPGDWIRVPDDVLVAAARHKRWAAPGVWVAPVTRNGKTGARSYLLGVGRGIAVPRHRHKGVEMICVLKGAFEDRGEIHGPGDFSENDESVEHRPRVTRDGECVCLIAADNALVARDLIGWIMQPLVGI